MSSFMTLGGLTTSTSTGESLALNNSSPTYTSGSLLNDSLPSTSTLRPYQKNDSSSFSAFSARSNLNKYHLQANLNPSQPPNFPSLLNPAMMAAQIGLLNSPNTLMAMMQVKVSC
ncbi:unnamed protein product [Dracunculus medinensis]|uniref:Ovule protein n=1 Tax=Dracunculus medinensis TaxID=318479 RepID=A0A0N4U709_DRAME|nr:unnamed protein product [Dracunculus medinensis]